MVGKSVRKCLLLCALGSVGNPLALAAGASTESSKQSLGAEAPLQVEAAPEQVQFLDVPLGDTYTQAVRLTNVGETTLQIKKIIASSQDFQISGVMLPVVVAHGTSESFTIAYRAKTLGRINGEICIFTNLREAPLVVQVKASAGAALTELTASEMNLEFEDVPIGSSGRKEILLTNSGNREVKIAGITTSGAGFSTVGATAAVLSPGQNISVGVNFAPSSASRHGGSLTVTSPEGRSLLEIPLAGSGAAASQSTVKLNWEESPVSVAGYVIYRSAEASGPYLRISTSATASLEYVDTGLAAGHTYYYVVTAITADETESEYSAPISATVPGV